MDTLHKRFPAALLAVYFLKTLFLTATPMDVGILLVLAASAAFHEAWSHTRSLKVVDDRIDLLQTRIKEVETSNQELRAYVSTQKLSQQLTQQSRGTFSGR